MKLKVVVDLGAIRRNIDEIKRRVSAKIMLMVKSDAYGHGIERVALATCGQVDSFGVATAEEGEALRAVGIKNDVLTLICPPHELKRAFSAGLTVGLYCFDQLAAIEDMLGEGAIDVGDVRVHVKVDTGMHRLGFAPGEIGEVVGRLKAFGVEIGGVYSHLRSRNREQIAAFKEVAGKVKSVFPRATAHLAASANLDVKSLSFDCVRVGISAYRGAMTVLSEVVEARRIFKGERIGYGNFVVDRDMNTAVIFGGYGDGVKREAPSSAFIRSQRCKTVGRVCMDMFMVDTGDMLPSVGEEVVLLSPQTASEVARERKTIYYTVCTGWHNRIERVYVDDLPLRGEIYDLEGGSKEDKQGARGGDEP